MGARWIIILFIAGCVGDASPDSDLDPDSDSDKTADDSAADSESTDVTVGTTARVVNTGGLGLRLRTAPDANAAVILVIPEGASVKVIAGPSNAWYRVTYDGSTGWAHGDYLQTVQVGGKNNLLPWTADVAYYVTQGHNGGSHVGLGAWAWDFGTPAGTPIRAAHFGTVRLVKGDSTVGGCSQSYSSYANYVIVDQGNGYESLYLHLSSVTVGVGQSVERGDIIGYSGQTGWSCGAHLHFQVQLSPSNGGGNGYYNPSINDVFYDLGYPYDPVAGTLVTSKNGVSDQPRVVVDSEHHAHGDGAEWDLAMRAASDAAHE